MSNLYYEYGLLPGDLAKSLRKQRKYIEAEVKQNQRDLARVQAFKETQGEITGVTKFERPVEEELRDQSLQNSRAFASVQQVIRNAGEAQVAFNGLASKGLVNDFNQYAPTIIEDMNKRFRNVTPDFFLKYVENFITRSKESGNLIQYYYPTTGDYDGTKIRELYETEYGKKIRTLSQKDINILKDMPRGYRTDYSPTKEARFLVDNYKKRVEGIIQIKYEIALLQTQRPINTATAGRIRDLEEIILPGIESVNDALRGRISALVSKVRDLPETPANDAIIRNITKIIEEAFEVEGPFGLIEMSETDYPDEALDIDEEEEEGLLEGPFTPAPTQTTGQEEVEFVTTGEGLARRGMMKGAGRGGMFFMKGARPMMGRGLALEAPVERFVPFGRFVMSIPALEDGFIQVRYPSQGTVADEVFRRKVQIGKGLRDFMLDLVDRQKMSGHKFNRLASEDKATFKRLVKIARLGRQLGIDEDSEVIEDEDEKRFQVLIGQIRAGNENKELKRQLVMLLSKFILEGRIEKEAGDGLISELLE